MADELERVREAARSDSLPPPASPRQVAALEEATGGRLPTFLREVYLGIADGGFGPGHGLIPLGPRPGPGADETVLELYRSFREPDPEDPGWAWPEALIPICDWGCAILSCVGCSTEEGAVIRFDPNGHGPGVRWESAFEDEGPSIRAWLADWASGTLEFDL